MVKPLSLALCTFLYLSISVFVQGYFDYDSVLMNKHPNASVTWIFIHYHKTGTLFLGLLIEAIQMRYAEIKRLPWAAPSVAPYRLPWSTTDLIKISEKQMYQALCPELFSNWNELFNDAQLNENLFRVVHLVREPHDMVLSGYLYHSKTPAPEMWLLNVKFNPCSIENGPRKIDIKFYSKYYGMFMNKDSKEIEQMLMSVVSLCEDLRSKYQNTTNNYHSALLRSFEYNDDHFDGLRYEACRSLISAVDGDVLRMGLNLIQQHNTSSKYLSKVILTSDFPLDDNSKTYASLKDMLSFLTAHSSNENDVQKPFYFMIVPEQGANYILMHETKSHFSSHITSGKLSLDKRGSLIGRLKDDLILGPVLDMINRTIIGQLRESF